MEKMEIYEWVILSVVWLSVVLWNVKIFHYIKDLFLGPKVKCNKCGSTKMNHEINEINEITQMRPDDEPSAHFSTCLDYHHKYKCQ